MKETRQKDVARFYRLMDALEERLDGARRLSECSGKLNWPRRGVYFFMEDREGRTDSGSGPRIVRVGTHALSATSRTTLWNRLSQHRGAVRSGGGNHRGSVFRLLLGTALIGKGEHDCGTWNDRRGTAPPDVRAAELLLEQAVSERLGAMRILWLEVDDEPGKQSKRGLIERGAIALLSNYGREAIDAPSDAWLGHHCTSPFVRQSGLWNQNHVRETHDEAFLDILEELVGLQKVARR